MDLHKFGIKFFATDARKINILKLIPIYHRWIQEQALEDLLVDVADYSHVPSGPGVMLIAHEGNYALDETGDERGVVYYSKHKLAGQLPQRITQVAQKALKAAQLMSADEDLKGALQVSGTRLQFFSNDRLVAPNTDAAYAQIEPALRVFLDRFYEGAPYSLEREKDPKERLAFKVQVQGDATVDELLARLS